MGKGGRAVLGVLALLLGASACGSGGATEGRDDGERPGASVATARQPAGIPWADQPYPECGDLQPQVVTTINGDLDGDATEDAVVGVRCETLTAGAPNVVIAFLLDGTTGAIANREVLISDCNEATPCDPRVRDAHLVGDLELAIVDGTVTIGSKAYSEDAPLCCPDLDLDLRFEWTGEGFDQVPRGR